MTEHPVVAKRKLIEVALPLDAINKASAREKSIRHGHPSTLHLWWSRKPLAAARAVIFAQMVDDPSANPDLFPTEAAQEKERQQLFEIIEWMIQWKTEKNKEDHKRIDDALQQARNEIWQSWRRTCAENANHPRADELFNRDKLPAFHDPFAGGGSLPLEAQRLGLEAHASDLNPVAVLINKAMIEIPPKFAGKPPVNPASRPPSVPPGQLPPRGGKRHSSALPPSEEKRHSSALPPSEEKRQSSALPPSGGEMPKAEGGSDRLIDKTWRGAEGLAEDVRYYGQWMRDEAERRIGHLYPKVLVTEEMAADRPDLEPYIGRELTVIAWIWARTVKSPNPAFADVDVPLASTFVLSKKKGKEAWVEPLIEDGGYRFKVRTGTPPDLARNGTKVKRANFRCLLSDTAISSDYIKSQGQAGQIGSRLMAIVANAGGSRILLSPMPTHEHIADEIEADWQPSVEISGSSQYLGVKPYGMTSFSELFTKRQLIALTTFSELINDARGQIRNNAVAAGLADDETALREGGAGASAYADAVSTYLVMGLSRMTDICNALCPWEATKTQTRNLFRRQAFTMLWEYAENNVFGDAAGDYSVSLKNMAKALEQLPGVGHGSAVQEDAMSQTISADKVIAFDPPYYDNVPYSDIADFFYVWLRHGLWDTFPDLFTTLATPKESELVAFAHRHSGGKSEAMSFFLDGMASALTAMQKAHHPEVPVSIFYAFKQSEKKDDQGFASTGWETFLDAVITAGWSTNGTWPVRTELVTGLKGNLNSLASSIVLVCRPRPSDAQTATRREFNDRLRLEFPRALVHLQRSNIAPVDLAQASIGPGMRIFTEYREVLKADGSAMTVREALALINATLDEVLAEQEGEFEPDSRWALTWFEQHGFDEGEFGDAEQLSKAKNTSPDGLVQAGVIESRRGKVRLNRPSELDPEWDPQTDRRPTVWEMTHHLIRLLESEGEPAAAELAASLGAQAETARDLAYRLYVVSDRKKRAEDARQYNALVQSWPEIMRLAQLPSTTARQADLEFAEE